LISEFQCPNWDIGFDISRQDPALRF